MCCYNQSSRVDLGFFFCFTNSPISFIYFVVINPCVLSANRWAFCFINVPISPPTPQASLPFTCNCLAVTPTLDLTTEQEAFDAMAGCGGGVSCLLLRKIVNNISYVHVYSVITQNFPFYPPPPPPARPAPNQVSLAAGEAVACAGKNGAVIFLAVDKPTQVGIR